MRLTNFAFHVFEKFTEFIENKSKLVKINYEAIKKDIIKTLDSSAYINENIINDVRATMKVCHEKHVVFNKIAINYEFWDTKINKCVADFFLDYVFFLLYYFEVPPNTKLDICLINYTGKKKLPPKNSLLTSEHINSGVTFRISDTYSKIIVYRQEEMPKVLLHEIIHGINVDFDYIDISHEESLMKLFCKESKLTINETLTDSLTCLLNTIIYTMFENRHNPKKFLKRVRANWRKEYSFMKAQCYKITSHMDYSEAISKKCTTLKLKEGTHALAYYVLKAVILSNLNMYLKFITGKKSKDNFIKLIHTRLSKIDLSVFGKEEAAKSSSDTLRMSSFDIVNFICL
jgi:hypothetical protein